MDDRILKCFKLFFIVKFLEIKKIPLESYFKQQSVFDKSGPINSNLWKLIFWVCRVILEWQLVKYLGYVMQHMPYTGNIKYNKDLPSSSCTIIKANISSLPPSFLMYWDNGHQLLWYPLLEPGSFSCLWSLSAISCR